MIEISAPDVEVVRLKVLLLGDPSVGKTSLVRSYFYKEFTTDYKKSLGVDFLSRKIEVDGRTVELVIWDVAGEARFASFKKFYLSNAHGAMLVFDCTRRETLTGLSQWVNDFAKYSADATTLMVSNKVDLPEKIVYFDEAKAYAQIYGASDCVETSAKEMIGLEQAFKTIARQVLEAYNLRVNTD
ncbi:MAG: Rab family GTPase [Candidatus Odinarchaeota archaeon]